MLHYPVQVMGGIALFEGYARHAVGQVIRVRIEDSSAADLIRLVDRFCVG